MVKPQEAKLADFFSTYSAQAVSNLTSRSFLKEIISSGNVKTCSQPTHSSIVLRNLTPMNGENIAGHSKDCDRNFQERGSGSYARGRKKEILLGKEKF